MTASLPVEPGSAPTSTDRSATAKRTETRAHILATAITTVDEVGISGASASEIARRAGLSWGVIQYHFGDRLGLLLATFDFAIDRFADDLASWSFAGAVDERCAALVDAVWSRMTTPTYRSRLEIQLELSRQPAAAAGYQEAAGRAGEAARGLWLRTFPDLAPALVVEVQALVMSSLRGFAVSHTLGTDDATGSPGRTLLVAAACRVLEPGSTDGRALPQPIPEHGTAPIGAGTEWCGP